MAALGLFVVAFQNYDQLPTFDSMRQGGSTLPPTNANPDYGSPATSESSVDWTQFAYTQYVTNSAYLCNSVMIFETLHRLKSKADRVMMYPENFLDPVATTATTDEGKLLIKARNEYNVKLVPVAVQKIGRAHV